MQMPVSCIRCTCALHPATFPCTERSSSSNYHHIIHSYLRKHCSLLRLHWIWFFFSVFLLLLRYIILSVIHIGPKSLINSKILNFWIWKKKKKKIRDKWYRTVHENSIERHKANAEEQNLCHKYRRAPPIDREHPHKYMVARNLINDHSFICRKAIISHRRC